MSVSCWKQLKHLLVMIAVFLNAAAASAEGASAPVDSAKTVSWRGDGSGFCPGSTSIPTQFDEKTNIKWKVSLPSWGHSAPVVVNNKVLVVCDGGWQLETPTLLCFDADSGREQWRAPIDVVDTLPKDLQSEARKRRIAEWQRLTKWGEQCNRVRKLGYKDSKQAEEQSLAAGYPVWMNSPNTKGLQGYKPNAKMGAKSEQVENYEWLKRNQVLFYDSWFYWYTKVFPSPVTDGTSVWVVTSLDVAACYDLKDGRQKWIVRLQDNPDKWKYEPDAMVSSPVVAGGVLVVNREYSGEFIGLDQQTGQIKWRTSNTADREVVKDSKGRVKHETHLCSPVVMQLKGEPYIVNSYGVVVRVRDGKFMHRIVDSFSDRPLSGIATGVAIGDIFLCPVSASGGGSRKDQGTRAFRLSVARDSVTSEGLWQLLAEGEACSSIVAVGKNAYLRYKRGVAEVDLATGKILSHTQRAGHEWIGFIAGGGYLMTTDVKEPGKSGAVWKANFAMFQVPGLKAAGEGTLQLDPVEAANLKRWSALQGGDPRWGWANPFIYRNRIYIRSNESLYCIGD